MIRTLYQADIPQVLAIEKAVHIAPWNEETFRVCFKQGYLGWLITAENKKIIGYVIAAMGKEECHVLNLAVDHPHQRQKYGQQLLNYALQQAKSKGLHIVYLEVRRSNIKAIQLYKKMQFQLIGERKDYYPTVTGFEDALIYAKLI